MLIFAYDIERSGPRVHDFTMAIGAALMDGDTGQVIQLLFLQGYVPGAFRFDQECWTNFWSKHTDQLHQLEYHGPMTFLERQRDMILEFQTFRQNCEHRARVKRVDLAVVSDTEMFDKGFLNDMISTYTTDLPLPYRISDGQYGTVWNVYSMQRGMMMMMDPNFKGTSGFFRRMQELYDVPRFLFQHDHLPHHDAAYICFQFWVMDQIRLGRIRQRNTPLTLSYSRAKPEQTPIPREAPPLGLATRNPTVPPSPNDLSVPPSPNDLSVKPSPNDLSVEPSAVVSAH